MRTEWGKMGEGVALSTLHKLRVPLTVFQWR